LNPGMRTAVHRHSGAEAWYLFTGTQCLKTPEGITVVKAGEGAVVREGPPMMLSSVGNDAPFRPARAPRQHSPWTSPVTDWKPARRCLHLSRSPAGWPVVRPAATQLAGIQSGQYGRRGAPGSR